jgi:hypothetical protein
MLQTQKYVKISKGSSNGRMISSMHQNHGNTIGMASQKKINPSMAKSSTM